MTGTLCFCPESGCGHGGKATEKEFRLHDTKTNDAVSLHHSDAYSRFISLQYETDTEIC